MTHIDLAGHHMLAMGRNVISALRSALLRDGGPAAIACLQEAGYAGGETIYSSFGSWLRQQGKAKPDELEIEEFQSKASSYFRDAGWGTISVGTLNEVVATIDSEDWGEADPESHLEHPGCHLTTGMFADFFGRISDVPLAVLEVECRSMGAPRCRFLLGNSEVMQFVYGEMERGSRYDEAVAKIT
ncbi:MAG TPA: V4R domain-containing protein [Gemmatimonadaceae bacterium]|nr:V4R domain-containing protein [Gemmatimonadaceae bacterium]